MKPLRKCLHCGVEANSFDELTLFIKGSGQSKYGKQNICKECQKIYSKNYRQDNIDKVRRNALKYSRENKEKNKCSRLRREYGISLDDYRNILKSQNYKCRICGIHADNTDRGLLVDHCHKDGHVRGLLCDDCNKALGYLKDSFDNLLNAISYLKDNGRAVDKEVSKVKDKLNSTLGVM